MLSIDKDVFAKNLRLTQRYCDIQKIHTDKNHSSIFRSFNPKVKGDEIFKFKLSDYGFEKDGKFNFLTDWSIDPIRENENLIEELFEKQLIHKSANITENYPDKISNGDILITQVDNTLTEGISEVVSSGLIDVYDCPPIDTWFYLMNSTQGRLLFSWIPHVFVSLAKDGILVNSVECIGWFKSWYPNEHKQMTEYLSTHIAT